ncbi:hypothetical protein Drorol1_Dr00011570 [Drosera rotundifolia]
MRLMGSLSGSLKYEALHIAGFAHKKANEDLTDCHVTSPFPEIPSRVSQASPAPLSPSPTLSPLCSNLCRRLRSHVALWRLPSHVALWRLPSHVALCRLRSYAAAAAAATAEPLSLPRRPKYNLLRFDLGFRPSLLFRESNPGQGQAIAKVQRVG